MQILAVALAIAAVPHPAPRPMFMAVLAETSSGFATLAECERALAPSRGPAKRYASPRGSLFNRNAGNVSRCEMVDGEPLIVVVPKPFANRAR